MAASLIRPGAVAKCKRGIIGIIDGHKSGIYFGRTLNNKAWESMGPELLAESVYEYIVNGLGVGGSGEELVGQVIEGTPVKKKVAK